MANTIVLGSDLMLFKAEKALAAATSCKLSVTAGELETSSKDSGKWTSKQAGKLSWTCSSENLFVMTDYTELIDAMIARTPVEIQFSSVANADSDNGVPTEGWQSNADGYKGQAIITSIEATATDGENATYSVQMSGTGALTKVTA